MKIKYFEKNIKWNKIMKYKILQIYQNKKKVKYIKNSYKKYKMKQAQIMKVKMKNIDIL